MPIFYDAPVVPDALTAFVREVPMAANLALSNAIPTETVDDNKVDFAERVHSNRVAEFRAFDGAVTVGQRDSGSTSEVELLPLSNSLGLGEYERLQMQFARTKGTNVDALVRAIYNDAENLVGTVRNRIELAWGDVLTDGKLTINEGGYVGEADFGVPAENIVAAATSWLDADAKPLSDLFAWTQAATDTANNGSAPERIRTSLKVIRALQSNKEIVDAVFGSNGGRTRVTREELDALLSSEGLPTLAAPYDLKLDVRGAATRVIPEDRVLLTPASLGDLGYTAYGVTATSLELVDSAKTEMSFADAPGIVGIVVKNDGIPFRQFTMVDAVAMPILEQPTRLFIASV
jgi:hypothetical protein